ncbi:hypothetical protein [Bacillus wiedmannii]|uniref:hypothetical protein n=1 Tax=Bacillus wiedmannii TaxID=1890302 RepID=UPI003D96D48E
MIIVPLFVIKDYDLKDAFIWLVQYASDENSVYNPVFFGGLSIIIAYALIALPNFVSITMAVISLAMFIRKLMVRPHIN